MSHFPKPFFRKSRKLWYVQIRGKQHNLGPDKDQAFELYHQLMQQRVDVQEAVESVLVIIDKYLDWCSKNRAPETYEWYRSRLQKFAETIPRNLTVDQLKPYHVQGWIDANVQWGNGSKRNGCKAIQRAMRWAVQQGYMQYSPIAHMEKPAMGKREVVISEAEYARILNQIPDPNLKDLVEVSWHSGCRPQESLRVEPRHVDLSGSRWIIPVSEAKTDLVRVVYLNEQALAITKRRLLKGLDGHLFQNSAGRSWTTDAVNCALERVQIRMGKEIMRQKGLDVSKAEVSALVPSLRKECIKKGIRRPKRPAELNQEARNKLRKKLACTLAPRYCLYHFRHTWMNRLLTGGVDAMTVAILAGHRDPSMLAKTYEHLSQNPRYLLEQVRRVAGQSF